MSEGGPADAWTRAKVAGLAQEYFPGRTDALLELVRGTAQQHEREWRSGVAGVFRPTAAMYALALGWHLDTLGPACVFCEGDVDLPRRPVSSEMARGEPALRLRVPAHAGGLNVPQNLVLCHAGCAPNR